MNHDDLVHEIPGLYRFAMMLVRDEHLAADLTQDTLTRAIERSHQYRGDAPLGAWLKRILRNIATDRARRSDREVVVDDIDAKWHDDDYTVDPADVLDHAATRAELEDALTRLPFIYRSAVLLHDVEQWTVQEIVDLDEIGLPAAKQRLRRGRMALVSALAAGAERRHAHQAQPNPTKTYLHSAAASSIHRVGRKPNRLTPYSACAASRAADHSHSSFGG